MKNILYTKYFNEDIKEDVNIILSPQFYWIKEIDIPIKSLKNAKNIAKNYFKLNEEDYFFTAIQNKDIFFAIAIPKNLDLKIKDKYIKSIHIAQTEFFEFECVKIDDKHCLKKIGNIIFCFPFMENEKNCIDVNKIINKKLSKYNFDFKNILNLNTLNVSFFIATFILSLLFLVMTFKYSSLLDSIQQEKYNLAKKYNLPSTIFQIDSILANLKALDNKQIQIRKDLEFFSHIPLENRDRIVLLEKRGDKYILKIKTNKNLDKIFLKKFKIIQSTLKNGFYKVEIK